MRDEGQKRMMLQRIQGRDDLPPSAVNWMVQRDERDGTGKVRSNKHDILSGLKKITATIDILFQFLLASVSLHP